MVEISTAIQLGNAATPERAWKEGQHYRRKLLDTASSFLDHCTLGGAYRRNQKVLKVGFLPSTLRRRIAGGKKTQCVFPALLNVYMRTTSILQHSQRHSMPVTGMFRPRFSFGRTDQSICTDLYAIVIDDIPPLVPQSVCDESGFIHCTLALQVLTDGIVSISFRVIVEDARDTGRIAEHLP